MTLTTFPLATERRARDLATYMDANVLDQSSFHCSSERSCRQDALFLKNGTPRADRSFWEGQMSHVGKFYDTESSGIPWRVMVVGMEVGRPQEHITLLERRLQQRGAIDVEFKTRRPHMKGTTSALRLAFGRDPGTDYAGEMLTFDNDPTRRHVMECYALANMRLCSAVVTGTTTSAGTQKMSQNCLRHLEATVRILEPTLVILQGVGIGRTVMASLKSAELVDRSLPHLHYCELGGVTTLVADFPHPYQQGSNSHLNWGRSASTEYLDSVVSPTIRAARKFALD